MLLQRLFRLYNVYLANVTDSGYIGNKLVDEISCAANGKNIIDSYSDGYTAIAPQQSRLTLHSILTPFGGVTTPLQAIKDGVEYTEESWAHSLTLLTLL